MIFKGKKLNDLPLRRRVELTNESMIKHIKLIGIKTICFPVSELRKTHPVSLAEIAVLRRKREDCKLSQREVSALVGSNRSTYCAWEKGETQINRSHYIIMLHCLNEILAANKKNK